MGRLIVAGKCAGRYSSWVVLGILAWITATDESHGQQRWTHLLRPDQGTARFLGLGYGHGYHKSNPGPNSDYYNPYTTQNNSRISRGTEHQFPVMREQTIGATPPRNNVAPVGQMQNRPKVPYEDLWLNPEQANGNDFAPNPPPANGRPNSANENSTSSLRSVLNKF